MVTWIVDVGTSQGLPVLWQLYLIVDSLTGSESRQTIFKRVSIRLEPRYFVIGF